jgi:Na+-driven multidrug efflux pump
MFTVLPMLGIASVILDVLVSRNYNNTKATKLKKISGLVNTLCIVIGGIATILFYITPLIP